MSLQFYLYVMTYIPLRGKEKKLRQNLASDEEAKNWARYVVEQARGGTAELILRDGSIYKYP
jgi:hypothetical protein